MRRDLIILILVLAAGGGGTAFLLREKAAPTTAEAASTPPSDPGSIVVAAGRVEPVSEEIQIGTELDGKISSVSVEEGERVRKGQVIATLVNGDYVARILLAEATVQERAAVLDRLKNGARDQERREANALAEEAKAVLAHALSERDRRRFLLEKGAISKTEYEQADREYNVALARTEATRQRASLISADTRVEEIQRAEAEVASARARLAEAKAAYEKTVLVSPINGVVLYKHKRTGESVSTSINSPILTLGDTSKLRVRIDVDETDVARIAMGQPVIVKASAYGKREFRGSVSRIGSKLGRKNIRTDEPTERVDTKILETLVDLEPGSNLPVGLRVDAYIHASPVTAGMPESQGQRRAAQGKAGV